MDMNQSPMLKAADFDFQSEASKAGGGVQGATAWTPSDNAMASSQLTKILQTDNKLMQQARARAGAASARRGLMNSSIGVEAGESAALGVALPLAQQDANTYAQSEQFNASAANDFARDANAFGRNASLTKYQGILAQEAQGRDQTWRSGESALDRTQQLTMQDRDFGFRRGESALDRGLQLDMQGRDQSWRTGERIGSQDFTAGQSALDRTFQSTERQADRTFQREERVDTQKFQAGENAIQRAFQTGERIGSQDFSAAQAVLDREQQLRVQQLQESGMDKRQAESIAAQERENKASRIFTAEQAQADRAFRGEQAAMDRTFTAGENQANRVFQRDERLGSQEFAGSQNQLERDFRGEQAGLDRTQQRDLQTQDQQFRANEADLSRKFDEAQRGLDRQQQVTLQNNSQEWQAAQNKLNQQFQMDFEKFRLPMNMMANFTDKMQSFVTQVMSDPNLDATARDQAIKNYYGYSQQTMGWMSTFFGQAMPNMTGGPNIQPVTGNPGAGVTAGSGTTPNIPVTVDVGVPRPTPAPTSVFSSPERQTPAFNTGGMTARDIYTSGDQDLIQRYRESLA